MIPTAAGFLTTPEIRYLLAKLLFAVTCHPAFLWAWSLWRRRHQANAATYHRRKRTKRNCSADSIPLMNNPG